MPPQCFVGLWQIFHSAFISGNGCKGLASVQRGVDDSSQILEISTIQDSFLTDSSGGGTSRDGVDELT